MKNCEKPELSPELRQKLNDIYVTIKNRFWTKQELADMFNTGERQIRDMISTLSHKVPVISMSGTDLGYKVACSKDDLEFAKTSCAEIQSRIDELEKRKKPLMEFIEKYGYYD